jgi:hypothetical protein
MMIHSDEISDVMMTIWLLHDIIIYYWDIMNHMDNIGILWDKYRMIWG